MRVKVAIAQHFELLESDSEVTTHDELDPSSRTSNLTNQPRRSNRVRKPLSDWWKSSSTSAMLSKERENEEQCLLTEEVCQIEAPRSYTEATSPENIDFWKPGIDKEQTFIRENGTFTLFQRLPSMHVIPCRYVFRVKQGGPKVRLVAKGFRQVQGVDYHETFAPVVSLPTLRMFLAIVSFLDLECDQMDVVTAFLN